MRRGRDLGLFVAGFGVACALVVVLVLWIEKQEQVARLEGDLRSRIGSLEDALRSIDAYSSMEDVQSVHLDLVDAQRKLERLTKKIPKVPEISEFLWLCQSTARNLGLELSIQDIDKTDRGFYEEALIELSVTGTPEGLQRWVDRMEASGRFIWWVVATIASSEDRRIELRVSLQVSSLVASSPPEVSELCRLEGSIPAPFYAPQLARLEKQLLAFCEKSREDQVLVDVTLELAHTREQIRSVETMLSTLEVFRKPAPRIDILMRAELRGRGKQAPSVG